MADTKRLRITFEHEIDVPTDMDEPTAAIAVVAHIAANKVIQAKGDRPALRIATTKWVVDL